MVYTEGYVITERSFGSMGIYTSSGISDLWVVRLQELFCDADGGFGLLNEFKAPWIGGLKLVLKKVSKAYYKND